MKIKCPNCKRIIGDTEQSLDCNFNCRGCQKTVHIKVFMAKTNDYFNFDNPINSIGFNPRNINTERIRHD